MYALIEGAFKIIEVIWNAPAWLVILLIFLFSVLYFIARLFGFDDDVSSSNSAGYGGGSNYIHIDETRQIKNDRIEQPFVFYDIHGNRRERGDCFYDSQGYLRSWGGRIL